MTLATHAPAETTTRELFEQFRNTIDKASAGLADTRDLHQALDTLEAHHGITPTTATDQGRTA